MYMAIYMQRGQSVLQRGLPVQADLHGRGRRRRRRNCAAVRAGRRRAAVPREQTGAGGFAY